MEEKKIKDFVLEYTKGIDLINCVDFSIENDFSKPDDYSDYGCNIDFITKDKSSVQDKDSLKEWYIHHHNKFVQSKMSQGDSIGLSFPPPYNFISEDEIIINAMEDNSSSVEIETDNGTYILSIVEDNDNDFGMIIKSIFMKSPWSNDLISIVE